MAKSEKLTFSARKDPLLRPRGPSGAEPVAPAAEAVESPPAPSAPPLRGRTPRPSLAAVEDPVGVVAIPTPRTDDPPAEHPVTPAAHPSTRMRLNARRVQTSVSLPPGVWDGVAELARSAGSTVGELLVAILESAMPDSPAGALDTLEQLLVSSPPDDEPHEERNHRLPRELRTQLDTLADALGPEVRRSLLIWALLAAHTPQNAEAARTLITARRIDAMRSAIRARDER